MSLNILTYLIIFIYGSYIGFRSMKKLKPFYYDIMFIALALLFSFIGINTRIITISSYEIYFSLTFFSFFLGNFAGRIFRRISFYSRKVRG